MAFSGVGMPHLDLPGVADTYRQWIPANMFSVPALAGNAWQPEATGDTIMALTGIPNIATGADILPRVVWSTSSTTTTQTATWRVRLAKVTLGTTALDGITLTALDTAITASAAVGTANVAIQTAQGRKLGGILTAQDNFLMVAVDLNAVSGLSLDEFTGDRVSFLGVILEHTRVFI